MHENNIDGKISSNYNGLKDKLMDFKKNVYIPFKSSILAITFIKENMESFTKATKLFNDYYNTLLLFSRENGIKSQSKFESTFLEEISCYLFKDIPEIKTNTFGIFNKGIYAGLKIDNDNHISILKKDVDFCIGKKSTIKIDNQYTAELIIPIIAVEVKTYLDATMFGEVKSSSKAIRSATPNSKAYILMGYKDLSDEHIISARQDSTLTEIFVLRKNKTSPMDESTLFEYWKEITQAISDVHSINKVITPGKLLNP